MTKVKVEGFENLVRDVSSNAIVNTNRNDYQRYIARIRAREKQGDEIRSAVKEINNLKAELREIKSLLQEVIKK